MKSKNIILTCSFLLIAVVAFCNPDLQKVNRKINKTFQVGSNTELKVENKYGNITVVEWSKNEINIDVEIIGKASNLEDAQKMADHISIEFNQSGNIVSALTIFEEIKNIRSNNRGTEVHYTISIPASVLLDLNNKYGNIQLGKTAQPFKCEVKYGNLSAGQLTGKTNLINCKYGNISIREISTGTISLGYGNITIDQAGELSLTTSYSKAKLERVNTLNASSKYDQYDLGIVKVFKLSGGNYGNFYIMRIENLLDAPSIKYGKIKIGEIAENFESIKINAGFTNINLYITPKLCFKTELSVRYGDIDINKRLDTSKLSWSKDGPDEYQAASGIIGSNSNPKAEIIIHNTYNNIVMED